MSRPAVSANGPGAGTEMLLGCARPSLCARAERCIACWPRQRVRSRTFSCLSFISPVTCSPVIYAGTRLSSDSHWTCVAGGLISLFAFSTKGMSGEDQVQSKRPSWHLLKRARSNASSHLAVKAAARNSNIPSALASHHIMPLPLSRRLITRRMALSTAPLPIGKPRLCSWP